MLITLVSIVESLQHFVLLNGFVTLLLFPAIFIVIAAYGKRLVRQTKPTHPFLDFCLGPEVVLAALSAELLSVFDPPKTAPSSPIKLTVVLIVITITVYLWALDTHRTWEPQTSKPVKQFAMLAIFCNVVGFMLLLGFVLVNRG